MRIELVESRSALPLGADEWNAIVATGATNTVFQSFEWFDNWWRVHGDGRQLFLLVVRNGAGVIHGLAPLMICTRDRRRTLKFIGTGNADYLDFILPATATGSMRTICTFLYEQRKRWDVIRLQNVPDTSPLARTLPEVMRELGLPGAVVGRVACSALTLRGAEAAARSVIDKYSVRRRERWFRSHGNLQLKRATTAAELDDWLPRFFDQHVERWSDTSTPSLFNDARNRQFYQSLAHALLGRGWLSFTVIEFDSAPIAFHFGFDYDGHVIWYKPSFAKAFAAHSPGLVMIRHLVQQALAADCAELDFTIGDEPFKNRFTNVRRTNVNISVFQGNVPFLFATLSYHLRQLAKRLLAPFR